MSDGSPERDRDVKKLSRQDLIPALIVLLFLVAIIGLVFELLIAGAAGRPVDPAATGILSAIFGLCVPALAAFYFRDSQKPPAPPKPPGESDEVKAAREVLRDYLDRTSQMIGRLQCST